MKGGRGIHILTAVVVLVLSLVLVPVSAAAADLRVEDVHLAPCPSSDPGSQTGGRSSVANCYALRGEVVNATRQPVADADLFAIILDASGEPVLPNRARVGSLGDVPPGRSPFAVRLAIPAGTPEPLRVGQVKARGFHAPVRTRAKDGEETLPLEQNLST